MKRNQNILEKIGLLQGGKLTSFEFHKDRLSRRPGKLEGDQLLRSAYNNMVMEFRYFDGSPIAGFKSERLG